MDNKAIKKWYIVMLLVFTIGGLFTIMFFSFDFSITFIWTFLISWGFSLFYIGKRIENEKNEKLEREFISIKENEYGHKKLLQDHFGLPIDSPQFKYIKGHNFITNDSDVSVWHDNGFLNILYNNEVDAQKYTIPLSDVNYFAVKGDIKQESELHGGNATIGQTMLAENLFGTAAAIKASQAIQSLKTIDQRKTIINYSVDGQERFMFFEGAELYSYLLQEVPEKEQSFVVMKNK